MLAHRNT